MAFQFKYLLKSSKLFCNRPIQGNLNLVFVLEMTTEIYALRSETNNRLDRYTQQLAISTMKIYVPYATDMQKQT